MTEEEKIRWFNQQPASRFTWDSDDLVWNEDEDEPENDQAEATESPPEESENSAENDSTEPPDVIK